MRRALRNRTAVTMAFALFTLVPRGMRAEESAAVRGKKEVVQSGDFTMELPLGLSAQAALIPAGNPMTAAKIELGKLLYNDPRLSKDNTVSCASCHSPYHGFADPKAVSLGVGSLPGGRNSPTVINRLFSKEQFWDGRAADLEEQAHGPLTNPVEMAMPSHAEVVKKVQAIKGYGPYFQKAFGTSEVTMPRIAQAIASYERTVVSGNSPYDRYVAGDQSAMSAAAVRGMTAFLGKGRCVTCHSGFNFTDERYHNLGVGMDKPKPDLGRNDRTRNDTDKGAFKTPTLRNIVETAPYMHDGSEATLMEVVELYDRGGVKNANLSPLIVPLSLTPQEKRDLVDFMLALSGDVQNLRPPAGLPQ
ncbi:cytochrome-c peroxidase [Candidatus Binatia bacterium]|nr:cytochrome-c peroxidase [Candidatus Binatia bacterium]